MRHTLAAWICIFIFVHIHPADAETTATSPAPELPAPKEIVSGACPLTCVEKGFPRITCREWRVDGVCFIGPRGVMVHGGEEGTFKVRQRRKEGSRPAGGHGGGRR